MRSKHFRTLVAQDFPEFLELTTGFKQAKPLPGPTEAAVQLRERALEAIERWTEKFGSIYPQVLLRVHFLGNSVASAKSSVAIPQVRQVESI